MSSFRSDHRNRSSRSARHDSHDSEPEFGSGAGGSRIGRKNSYDRNRSGSFDDVIKSKNHQPQRDFESDPRKTLFIGRLNPETTEDTLRKHFEKYGDIRSLVLIRDIITGDSRRYAFCEFRRSKEADQAYSEAHNLVIDGRRILVDREFGRTMKGWKPRRLGGGFGGHKESGQIRFGGRAHQLGPSSGGAGSGDYSSSSHQEYRKHSSIGYASASNNNNYGYHGTKPSSHPYQRDYHHPSSSSTGLARRRNGFHVRDSSFIPASSSRNSFSNFDNNYRSSGGGGGPIRPTSRR